MDDTDDIRAITRTVLIDGFAPLSQYRFEQRRRDGTWQAVQRDVYERGDGAVALLHDPKGDTVLLVRQFRLPVHLTGGQGHILAAPAGFLDGKSAPDRMREELREETGYDATTLHHLFDLYMSPAYITGKQSFFLGQYDRTQPVADGGGVYDEGEDITVEHIALDDALRLIAKGQIVCGKTVILLQALQARLA